MDTKVNKYVSYLLLSQLHHLILAGTASPSVAADMTISVMVVGHTLQEKSQLQVFGKRL